MRSYIPTAVIQTHKQAVFLARYQAVLRAAIVLVDPSYGSAFDALLAAVLAFDALSQSLYPLEE